MGTANQKMIQRFSFLTQKDQVDCMLGRKQSSSQLCRSAQEAVLITGLDALEKILIGIASQYWKANIGPLGPDWKPKQTMERAAWARRMSTEQRNLIRFCVRQWHEQKVDIKRQTRANRRWVSKCRSHHLCMEPWFETPSQKIDIENEVCEIGFSQNPFDSFEMGNWFGTCLSPRECNEMSPIPNVIDANKQVLLARDGSGNVIARKLFGITKEYKIGGFYFYSHWNNSSRKYRLLEEAIRRFATRMASDMNTELTDSGKIDSLNGLDWYDDGLVDWN